MADAVQTDAIGPDQPATLPFPIPINVRNSDVGIDDSGIASRLDEERMVATLHKPIPAGTVLFMSLDMRSMNATARGLIRVLEQHQSGDGLAFETLAEFVELNDDARGKIARFLSASGQPGSLQPPSVQPGRNFATDQLGIGPVYQRGPVQTDYQVASSQHQYFEPAPLRQRAKPTPTTKLFSSLGVTAYIIIALGIVAFFPAGRAIELMVWAKIAWACERTWYWASHIGDVKLYNNT